MGKKKLVETRCSPCYINRMITHLQEINADAKLAEIDAIGFGFVKKIPHWAVKQKIMIQLARAYDVETDTLIVDVGNIRVNAELIGRALRIPSSGVDIPKIEKKNPAHREIKEQFKKKTTTQLCDFVYTCPMDTEADRMNFRSLLAVMLNELTVQSFHPALVLSAAKAWSTRALSRTRARLTAWTASELEKKATNVIDEVPSKRGQKSVRSQNFKPGRRVQNLPLKKSGKRECRTRAVQKECKEASITNEDHKKSAKMPSRPFESKLLGSHTAALGESKIGTQRKLPVVRPKSSKGSSIARVAQRCKERLAVVSDSDDNKHVPDVRPKHRLFDDSSNLTGEQLNQDAKQSDAQQVDPVTPSTALVKATEYDFYKEFDLNFVQCPEVDEILLKVEQKRYTKPLDMEPLKTLEKPPTTPPITVVHPSLKDVKLGEDKEDMVRGWILNSSLNEEELLATYESRPYLQLLRKDLCTLKACGWVNSNETVIQQHNLKSFYNGPVSVHEGLGPNFGEDIRFFNKVDAAKRKWVRHWWLYVFDVARKRIVVIDSLHDEAHDDARKKLDSYAGRLIEDMAKVAIPTYDRSPNDPMCAYAKVPMQPNGRELMLDIVMGAHNESIQPVRPLLEQNDRRVRRNRQRNKKKVVKSPFTAPSTRTLMKRVGELPVSKTRKRRMQ
ncbi:uncharacterized protein DS421_16g536230 [Arachis hypogaea]|nr:uncharacterized protein DS421_16g536230 [Arachis hypogaea]